MKREPNGPKTRCRTEPEPKLLALITENEQLQAEIKTQLAAAVPLYELDSYSDADPALEGIKHRPPAAILVDLGTSRDRGPDGLHRLRSRFPHLPLIALPPANDTDAILLALMAGSVGCVVQPAAAEDLIRAVNEVLQGHVCLCHNAQAQLSRSISAIPTATAGGLPLTPRERQIVVGLLQYRTNQQIADSLGISIRTVETHLARLSREFEVHSRHELVRKLRH